MSDPLRTQLSTDDPYDDMTDTEFWSMLSAAKGEPYTRDQWEAHVEHLEAQLTDARQRLLTAKQVGQCKASRFG